MSPQHDMASLRDVITAVPHSYLILLIKHRFRTRQNHFSTIGSSNVDQVRYSKDRNIEHVRTSVTICSGLFCRALRYH